MPGLSAVLSSPLATTLHSGWRWWVSELSELVPARFAGNAKTKPTAELWLMRDAVRVDRVVKGVGERFVDERPIEALDAEGWQQLATLIDGTRAKIVLSPPDVYTTTLTLPKAARHRLGSAVALQLGEIAPIDPALLVWAIHSVRTSGDRIALRVTMAKAHRIERLAALFANHDLPAPPIGAHVDGAFVPLAAGHDANRTGAGVSNRHRALLVAGGLVASIPVTLLVAAAILTARADHASAGLETAVRPKLEAERRTRHAEQLRAALAPVAARPPLSNLLNDLAGRLPASAWLRDIGERPDGAVEFEVDAEDAETLAQALAEDPILPDVQQVDRSPTEEGRVILRFVAKRE